MKPTTLIKNQVNRVLARMGYELHPIGRSRQRKNFIPDIFGHKMYIDLNDLGITIDSIAGQPIENYPYGELGFWTKNLKPGHKVLDIGANIGIFTLIMARLVKDSGQVISFEPGPMSFSLLQRNVLINNYKNVTLVNSAVADREGDSTLLICRTGETDNRLQETSGNIDSTDERDAIPIHLVSIDSYLNNRFPIDFIKLDVQGSEFLAIKGMEKTIKNSPNIQIVMEYAPHALTNTGTSPKEFLKYLRSLGFDIYDVHESAPVQLMTDAEILNSYGGSKQPGQTNLLLKKSK